MKYDVYIECSGFDDKHATILRQRLLQNNIKCYDPKELIGCGRDIPYMIEDGIKSSSLVILLLSFNAFYAKDVLNRVANAVKKNKTILPIKIDNADSSLDMQKQLYNMQYIDASKGNFIDLLPLIIEIVKDVLKSPGKIASLDQEKYKANIKNISIISEKNGETNVQEKTKKFEPCDGEEPYIFISYSHRDLDVVLPIINNWHNEGYRIWYDEGIDPGNEWREYIANMLDGCAYFVIFISANSIKSKNVRNEVNFADSNDKPFLAIHIEETKLSPSLQLTIGSYQAIMKYKMSDNDFNYKMFKILPKTLKDSN